MSSSSIVVVPSEEEEEERLPPEEQREERGEVGVCSCEGGVGGESLSLLLLEGGGEGGEEEVEVEAVAATASAAALDDDDASCCCPFFPSPSQLPVAADCSASAAWEPVRPPGYSDAAGGAGGTGVALHGSRSTGAIAEGGAGGARGDDDVDELDVVVGSDSAPDAPSLAAASSISPNRKVQRDAI